jgi:hypothetical protein
MRGACWLLLVIVCAGSSVSATEPDPKERGDWRNAYARHYAAERAIKRTPTAERCMRWRENGRIVLEEVKCAVLQR